jgi:hypothetical protein
VHNQDEETQRLLVKNANQHLNGDLIIKDCIENIIPFNSLLVWVFITAVGYGEHEHCCGYVLLKEINGLFNFQNLLHFLHISFNS